MRRQPGFAATIVVTLAVGIAVNTTVFTIVNAAVLRPMPFKDADRLVNLSVANVGNAQNPNAGVSYLDFQDWQTPPNARSRRSLATAERTAAISGDERPAARVNAAYVSWNTFSMIGQPPALGRDFTDTDDREGGHRSSSWATACGARAMAPIRRSSERRFASAACRRRSSASCHRNSASPTAQTCGCRWWRCRRTSGHREVHAGWTSSGRLRPGVTIEQATTELSGITASLATRYPDTNRNTAPIVEPFAMSGPLVGALLALLGAVGFVQLIACANVANLMLARAADRSRDITLRMALGASRWRIRRQLLVESLVLASAGGVCGLALSYPGIQVFRNLPANSAPPYWVQFTMDGMVFSYFAALCVGSALVCGLVPAWHASRTSLAATLNDAGRGSAGSRSRRRWTGAFVVAQVAAALVLLTGAAMMMQNLISLVRTDVGVDSRSLMQMAFELRRSDDTPERRLLFLGQLEDVLPRTRVSVRLWRAMRPVVGARVRRLRIDGRPASEVEPSRSSRSSASGGATSTWWARAVDRGPSLAADDLRSEMTASSSTSDSHGCISG